VLGDALCQSFGCRLCYTATFHHPSADVHQAIQECAGCQNHTRSPELSAPDGLHANNALGGPLCLCRLLRYCRNRLYYQFLYLVLPDI